MSSKWQVIKRSLVLLRRLQRDSADKDALIRAFYEAGIENDGPILPTQDAKESRFERALQSAREQLGATIVIEANYQYRLLDAGPFIGLDLRDESLMGLSFLLSIFDANEIISKEVRPLLEFIQANLTTERLQKLQRLNPKLRLDLRRLDQGEIHPLVREKIRYANKERRVVHFHYISPKHEGKRQRQHTVEPQRIHYVQGHYQLEGYCLHWKNPDGFEGKNKWFLYRFDHIQIEGLKVLSQRFEERTNRPVHMIHYRLSPKLARGNPSHHFEEMYFEQREDGWVDIWGKTNNLFAAEQIFLRYGQHCIVFAPQELRDKMIKAVQEMAQLYDLTTDIKLPDLTG
jgi:predicted DNA-binding transcriptional regulator YafY